MEQEAEIPALMQAIAMKIIVLLAHFNQPSSPVNHLLERGIRFLGDAQQFIVHVIQHQTALWPSQQAYVHAALQLLLTQMQHWQTGQVMPIADKRFNHDEWINHPAFNALSQHYVLAQQHINAALQRLDVEDKTAMKRVNFFARQYLDALSPAHFLQTNPHLIAQTLQDHGKNLLRGFHHFLTDLESGSEHFKINMTDRSAFSVGENIAITPGKVIYKNELIELIQYQPQTPRVKAIPLLIIPPWINKYYILDLSPHNSFIQWLVSQGITVFVISWINPDARHADKGLDDYLHAGPMSAINVIQTRLHVPQVNALGFCIGGTLLALLLAYYQKLQQQPIHTATFLATLIDFSDPGDIGVYIDEQQIGQLEERMQLKGYLDGQYMANAFNSLRANDLIWSFFINHYLHGKPRAAFDILYWNADSTHMPARMHSEYLRWMYLHNHLITPNKIQIKNILIDINQINLPTFFVATQKDHIAPWQTVYRGFSMMRGPKRFLLGGSGHIAGIITPPGSAKYGYYLNQRHPKNPHTWLAGATAHTGSWWPIWLTWLYKKSGNWQKPVGTRQLESALKQAPGEYVHR